jgi:hypothetical protein
MSGRISTEELGMQGLVRGQRSPGQDEDALRMQREIAATMRGILQDGARAAEPKSMTAPAQSSEEPWRTKAADVPKGPPPGVEICDRMMDAQDDRDRMETLRKLGIDQLEALQKAVRARMIELATGEKKP